MPFCAISGYAKTLPLTASFPCVQPFPIGIFMSLNVQPMLWFAHKNYSLEGGLVRLAGIEPAWALARQILSLLCIPVSTTVACMLLPWMHLTSRTQRVLRPPFSN